MYTYNPESRSIGLPGYATENRCRIPVEVDWLVQSLRIRWYLYLVYILRNLLQCSDRWVLGPDEGRAAVGAY